MTNLVNQYEQLILKKLMYNPKLTFSQLQIEGLTSKHFNYYLKKLKDEELIEKREDKYELTLKGKEYVSRVDEANMNLEKQPKISVALIIKRVNENGDKEVLLNRRLKQPYYGKVGGFTGKIRFGETYEDAARREMMEETSLTGDFKFAQIYRKLAFDKGECLQDQIFAIFLVTNVQGEMVRRIDDQENFWCKEEDLESRDDLFNTYLDIKKIAETQSFDSNEHLVGAEGY